MKAKMTLFLLALVITFENFGLTLLAQEITDQYHYQYPYNNSNRLCRITVAFAETGNPQMQRSPNCYPGGRLLVSFHGNFLAANQTRPLITIKDLATQQVYRPAIGWGGSWGAEQTINVNANLVEGDLLTLDIQVQKDNEVLFQARPQLSILDTYHPSSVIALKKGTVAPFVENSPLLCSGKTVALFYDFLRMKDQGAHSDGSYLQFSPTVSFVIQMLDQQGLKLDTIETHSPWTFDGQYIFFRIPPPTKQLKINFVAQNSGLLGGEKFFDPKKTDKEEFYTLNCPL